MKRDNVAVNKVGPTDGIYNLQDFIFYRLNEEDLKSIGTQMKTKTGKTVKFK